MLKIFSSSGCFPCVVLEKFLQKYNIEYEKIDIEKDETEIEKYGITSVPSVVKDGKIILTGLPTDENKLKEVLGLNAEL